MMDDLRVQHFCIKWCLKLWEDSSETHVMRKTAFGDNTSGRTQIFSGIYTQTWGDLGGSVWESRLSFYRSHRRRRGESSRSRSRRLTKYLYGDPLRIRPLVWNIPANSKGGLECNCNCRGVVWERSDQSVVSWMTSNIENNHHITRDTETSVAVVLWAAAEALGPLLLLGSVTRTSNDGERVSFSSRCGNFWICPRIVILAVLFTPNHIWGIEGSVLNRAVTFQDSAYIGILRMLMLWYLANNFPGGEAVRGILAGNTVCTFRDSSLQIFARRFL